MSKPQKKRGPVERRVNIEGDWKAAVKKALKKKRPPGGWPKPKTGTK